MKTVIAVFLMFMANSLFAQVSINSNGILPDNSAMLDVKSSSKGLLIPRMTLLQRDGILQPANGLLVFCTDNNRLYFNQGTPAAKNWVMVASGETLAAVTASLPIASSGGVTPNISLSGIVPVSNGGTGQGTISPGKVLVGNGTSGILMPTDLHWDNTNNRLGIGNSSPTAKLDVLQHAYTAPAILGVNSNSAGTGIVGAGNAITEPFLMSGGCGGQFFGTTYGLYVSASASGSATERFSGYFANGTYYTFVCGYKQNPSTSAWTNYKIYGTGVVNGPIVKSGHGEQVSMFCPSVPELVVNDYGTGRLISGKCHVAFDAALSNSITVDDTFPLKVFIQPEGDCKGLFVTNKTRQGFDVVELQNGKSNIPFSWSIAASLCDKLNAAGEIESKHVGLRFPKFE